jgi:hypothetical protein
MKPLVVAGKRDSLGTTAQAGAESATSKVANIVRWASREKGTENSFAESLLGRGAMARPEAGKVQTVQ